MPLFNLALPEMFLSVMICIILLVDVLLPVAKKALVSVLSLLTLVICALLLIILFGHKPTLTFHQHFILDNFAVLLKLFIVGCAFFIFIYAKRYLLDRDIRFAEFHVLALVSVLGAMVMASANSMLVLFIGLELLSLPLYALVAIFRNDKVGSEAAMKYFIMGILASGLLLYGFSLIYGETGSIFLNTIAQSLANHLPHDKVLLFSLVFVVVAAAFKLGAVPFHMWLPDVYEGAPTPVTALLGTIPKLAAFALIVRLIILTMPSLAIDWRLIFQVIALLSLFLGNIVALVQTNIKRLLAYSTISHVGFILLALSLGSVLANSVALFYVLTYVLMAAGGFGMVLVLSKKDFESDNIQDFMGLNTRDVWLAAMMMMILFSMAGIPPFVGFDAKLFVISALVKHQHYYMALYALLMTVIGAFYYIRLIKLMYFDKPQRKVPIQIGMDARIAIGVNALLVLLLGIFPASLMHLCRLSFG